MNRYGGTLSINATAVSAAHKHLKGSSLCKDSPSRRSFMGKFSLAVLCRRVLHTHSSDEHCKARASITSLSRVVHSAIQDPSARFDIAALAIWSPANMSVSSLITVRAFLSPFVGQTVNVSGIVTGIFPGEGFFIQGPPSPDPRVSSGLFVFTESTTVENSVSVGDNITLSGLIEEFRSSKDPTFIKATELDDPAHIQILSTNHTVAPIKLATPGFFPPTQQWTVLDLVGPDGWLSQPNNQSLVDVVNPTLQPHAFGMDFWRSLDGMVVTVPSPTATDFPNGFGEFWVYGDWPVTGQNSRGGLTMNFGPDGLPDANPEVVIIAQPLDGTTNPVNTSTGMKFKDITGIVHYQFGFFYVLPFTAPEVVSVPSTKIPATTLTSVSDACTITIGDYNVENFAPNSTTVPQVGDQIANFLKSPDIMFMQEIQDNSGPTDDGTVDASLTLKTLISAIHAAGSTAKYNFTEVISANDQDGGQLGGNIRPAYLFKEDKFQLVSGSPVGGPFDATEPVIRDGKLTFTFNPGRLDPNNTVWVDARKPLVAAWETNTGQRFVTINLHNTAKSDASSSVQGDPRPPINSDVQKRTSQIEVIAPFVQSILALDPDVSLIVAGDYNEFVEARSVYAAFDNILFDVDVLADVPPVERYTYVFDHQNEQLDHIFVSKAISERKVEVDHVHVNNWQPSISARGSDHDPSVARLRIYTIVVGFSGELTGSEPDSTNLIYRRHIFQVLSFLVGSKSPHMHGSVSHIQETANSAEEKPIAPGLGLHTWCIPGLSKFVHIASHGVSARSNMAAPAMRLTTTAAASSLIAVSGIYMKAAKVVLGLQTLASLRQITTHGVQITDVRGTAFLSPLVGESVTLSGVVTGIFSGEGFFIQEARSSDPRVSSGLFVFSESSRVLDSVAVGDNITVTGTVNEFRSSEDPTFIKATELDSPTNIKVLSKGHTVTPIVLGSDLSPPTQQWTSLDLVGPDGWLSQPNNQSLLDVVNPTLQPGSFGIDFWRSLDGMLVSVPSPTATDFPNSFGEFWVYGDWPVTGQNSRGGLTMNFGSDGLPDANPEVVIIAQPLDGTTNPNTSTGVKLDDITGIVHYQFGFFYVLPLTAPKVVSVPSTTIPATNLTSVSDVCTITIGDYNVDNFAPTSPTVPQVADQIANFLNSPDIIFLQEIQDNSGPTDDGTVDASVTLETLISAIEAAGSAATYDFTEVISANDQDGGETGGNIRPAYLFKSDKFQLVSGSPVGGPFDATEPVIVDGELTFTFNPGRLDPNNTVWVDSRKPLVAAWEATNGQRFFTINLHDTAKSDASSSVQGDPRPPINSDVEKRTSQVEVIASFVQSILALDPDVNLIVAGDYNEFVETRSVFAAFDNILFDVDVLANVPAVERYTYVFDHQNEQLDHIFVSQAISERVVEVDHVHVNNWQPSLAARASDHDPSVARIRIFFHNRIPISPASSVRKMSTPTNGHSNVPATNRIIEEGYLVQWATIDPRTGELRKPSWVTKREVPEEAIAQWEQRRMRERRISPNAQTNLTTPGSILPTRGAVNQRPHWRPSGSDVVMSDASGAHAGGAFPAREESTYGDKRRSPPEGTMSSPPRAYPALHAGHGRRLSKEDMRAAALFIPKRRREPHNITSPPARTNPVPAPRRNADRESMDLYPNEIGKAMFAQAPRIQPPSRMHWLADEELAKTGKYRGVIAEVHGSYSAASHDSWADGRFEGKQCMILSVEWAIDVNKTTARVKWPNGNVMSGVPVQYLERVQPNTVGHHVLLLRGQHKGDIATLQKEMEGRWYLSVVKHYFEVENEALVSIEINVDEQGNTRR
ncbi:hypothetical protein NM688_g5532 [Phlebia brevispora]|uniref:Uncharacterized protein n=1 Tax=Phlebia brevispora TaxID=194682 RepID=A0ACC1STV2_9APHY|nr:hypothetical protein NM688_g5532 [Phlebia brevispora]